MASFFDLLAQNQPNVKTSQALLVIGLQNDFLRGDGKLPVTSKADFVDRITKVVPIFRENAGDVIWAKTEYLEDRPVNDASGEGDMVLVDPFGLDSNSDDSGDDGNLRTSHHSPSSKPKPSHHGRRALDLLKRVSARKRAVRAPSPLAALPPPDEEEELFLSRASKRGPACVPSSPGCDFPSTIRDSIDSSADRLLITSHYSAFNSTKLLIMLRAKLVTELYICGCLSNISVYATALDAVKHGFSIYLVEDCMGYRKSSRHEEALKQMSEVMGAQVVTSQDIITELRRLEKSGDEQHHDGEIDDEHLQRLVGNLTINERSAAKSADARPHRDSNGSKVPSKSSRHVKIVSREDPDVGRQPPAEPPAEGASQAPTHKARSSAPSDAKQNVVKAKVRMRNRSKKESKEEDSDDKKKPKEVKREEAKPPQKPQQKPVEGSRKNLIVETSSPPGSATAKQPRDEAKRRGDESTPKTDRSLKLAKSQPVLSNSKSRAPKSPTSPTSPSRPHSLGLMPSAKSTSTTDLPDSTRPQSLTAMGKKNQSLATFPTLGPDDTIGEGDSKIIYDFLPATLCHSRRSSRPAKDEIFNWLYDEVHWQKMYHAQGEVPRLVCVQGEFGKDGSMPIYRHPSDQSLPLLHFTPSVQMIRDQVEKLVKHPVNHVLIQLYRCGNDYISEHSDKSLDIVRGSSIVNVSFGAQRTMRLRTKRSAKDAQTDGVCASKDAQQRSTQRIHMPHNSMFVLGQDTNMRWLHGINADKRLEEERSEAERAYSGMRISLTFRHIGTFLDSESKVIWGQGATSKDQKKPNKVINSDEAETEKMIHAFGKENQSTEFDWTTIYGSGFDVLHFRKAPADEPILFSSNDPIESQQIQLGLAELGLQHMVCDAPVPVKDHENGRTVCYRDSDINHTEVAGPVPILLYLDRYYQFDRSAAGKPVSASAYPTLLKLDMLRQCWTSRKCTKETTNNYLALLQELEESQVLHGGKFIAGDRFSVADCAAWPALDAIINGWTGWKKEAFPNLTAYYERLWEQRKLIGELRKELPKFQ